MMCPETGGFVCFSSDEIGGGFGPEKLDRREGVSTKDREPSPK